MDDQTIVTRGTEKKKTKLSFGPCERVRSTSDARAQLRSAAPERRTAVRKSKIFYRRTRADDGSGSSVRWPVAAKNRGGFGGMRRFRAKSGRSLARLARTSSLPSEPKSHERPTVLVLTVADLKVTQGEGGG